MKKFTEEQIGLVDVYADHCATFKKYWIIYMIGGHRLVGSSSEAKAAMIYWANEAYECGKALGMNDEQILQDVVLCRNKYRNEAA